MTTQQLIWITGVYLVVFVVVVYFTRATARRGLGALVGGSVAGGLFIGGSILGSTLGWWKIMFPFAPGPWVLFYVGTAISMSPIYLITWRVARRFGWRGLARASSPWRSLARCGITRSPQYTRNGSCSRQASLPFSLFPRHMSPWWH